ncbi:MAG: NAD(P)H-quinone oxidoreductase [Actinomycetia bacterium]|nr:NAD(P)H-quinone oxidoreductase [Actinomycetes bacterium]
MHAIVVKEPGGTDQMVWQEVPMPVARAGEVLIRTTAAGVNRADLLQRQGYYPPPPGASDLMGLECSGVVEALGPGVTAHAVGDPVVALLPGGGYAEYVRAAANECVAPPAGFDLAIAGGIMETAATVVSNFDTVRLARGETVLIHGGAGGVGSFAIQYARALGCRVLVTAGSSDKREYCVGLGANAAIDYHADWWDEVRTATGGHGADVILDVIGAAYLGHNVDVLADDGRLVIIGMQKGVRGELHIGKLLSKRGTVTATSLRTRPHDQKAAICAAVAERVWPLYEDGSITPPATTVLPLAEAARAHELLDSGDSRGKIVLLA